MKSELTFVRLLREKFHSPFTEIIGESLLNPLQSTSSFAKKKKPVDFDDELKIGDVWYDNMTKITIKVQLFWRLPYEM